MFPSSRNRPKMAPLLVFNLEADLDRHLEFLDFAVPDSSAFFHHFEPVHVTHRVRGLRDRGLDGLGEAHR